MKLKIKKLNNEKPDEYRLEQNKPNPFYDKTEIRFAIPAPGNVRLVVYNSREEQVRLLHDGRLVAGYYHLKWDGKDDKARRLNGGRFAYCLQAEGFVATRKLEINSKSQSTV